MRTSSREGRPTGFVPLVRIHAPFSTSIAVVQFECCFEYVAGVHFAMRSLPGLKGLIDL